MILLYHGFFYLSILFSNFFNKRRENRVAKLGKILKMGKKQVKNKEKRAFLAYITPRFYKKRGVIG